VIGAYVRLRWRLLRGALRRGGAEQVGAVLSTGASAFVGLGLGFAAARIGRTSDAADEFIVVYCGLVTAFVLGIGVVAGVAQPVDPRVLAAEPLRDRERVLGQLAASAFGPPGLAGIVAGIGVFVGMVRDVAGVPVVALATVAWLLGLLLVARTATNLLALLANRFPRAGQLAVGLAGLVFYGGAQLLPRRLAGLGTEQRHDLADAVAFTPPGRLGRAMTEAGTADAWWHLLLGAAWLVVLVPVFVLTTIRLTRATRHAGGIGSRTTLRSPVARVARRLCGTGVPGAIAWRSILVRFRTPRTALETFTGAGVGLSVVLVPALARDAVGSGAVLVGGAVQLAVLFMAGNSFGSDGPPITHELLTGADVGEIVAGKARSVAVVAAPLALIAPLIAAAVTDEWRYLPAGFGVGAGGVLAGTGAAIVQSALVPIAIPESDNPFAGGESGKGILAAVLLFGVLIALGIATVPIALALLWAVEEQRTVLVTLLGLVTLALGWVLARAGIAIATARVRRGEPELVASVTPAR
jgi:hypothetical protein